MSVVSNDGLSNLSSEWDNDYAKLQWIGDANDTQLIATFAITKKEDYCRAKEEEIKNCLIFKSKNLLKLCSFNKTILLF